MKMSIQGLLDNISHLSLFEMVCYIDVKMLESFLLSNAMQGYDNYN